MKRYIAFLDILGFKDLVENNSLDDVVRIYKESLKEATELAMEHWEEEEYTNDGLKLNVSIMSDSILFWSESTTTLCFAKVLISTTFFFQYCLLNGLPLRGAIDVGELEIINIDNENLNFQNIIIGKALTDAFSMEKSQDWAGCIISDKSIDTFVENRKNNEDNITLESFIEDKFIAKYNVPLKKGKISESYVINWADSYIKNRLTSGESELRTSFQLFNKNCNTLDVQAKIKNTIDFYNHFKDH